MKILITGSSGFVGTHLIDKLKTNHEVVPYDLKLGLDVLDDKVFLGKSDGCDVVIHLAAFVSVQDSWSKPFDYFNNNGVGTVKVIKNAIDNEVKRLIYVSTAGVYGDPLTPYGASKYWGEIAVNTYRDSIETVIVRPFNIYGKGQNPSYGYAIQNFIRGIKEKGEVTIYGSGKQTRDFIYVDDVVNSLELLLTAKVPNFAVDLGTGKKTNINELANLIGKVLGKKFKIKYLPPRKEVIESIADISGLKGVGIDVTEFVSLEEGLGKLIY
jgi:Nucleoside-diphosphate-sugar epimerases